MKHARILLSALAIALFLNLATAGENADYCEKNRHKASKALKEFCSRGDIMTPSPYSNIGKHVDGKVFASVNSDCDPPQWIPPIICHEQFNWMCKHHVSEKFYGRDNCQHWFLAKD